MTHTIHGPPGMTMTKTNTHTKTKTKCSKDPTYAIFLKSRGFKDIKYDNMSADQTRPDQTRPDQDRPGQRRLQSRGPNSRTFVLVKVMWHQYFIAGEGSEAPSIASIVGVG